jgi:hypothetical protein
MERTMATREITASAPRLASAGATLVLALALSACGGGGSAPVIAQAASRLAAAAAPAAAASASASPAPRMAAAATQNLLSNGDFESGMTDWVNWNNAQVIDAAGTAGASGASRAFRVGTGAGGAGHDVAGVVAGTTYRLTGQVKVSDPSEVVYIGINVLDAAGATIAQQLAPATSTTYSLAIVEVTAPAAAAKAVVYVWKNAGSGYGYVDDLVLAPAGGTTAPPAADNLVSNGGFESGLADWSNWGNAAAATGAASAGTAAVRVGTGAGGVGHDIATVTAGQSYHLGGQAKVSDATEVVFLGLRFMDAAGSNLGEQNVAVGSTTYSAASLDMVAPANATRALVYVWKNAGSGFGYVDEISLAAGSSGTPATSPPPAPPPQADLVPLASWPTTLLQTGNANDAYWVEDGVWGAWGLTRGGYTGTSGTTYEQYTGVSPKVGPSGEVAFRLAWKWPSCCNEIKSFPSIVSGRKPGWYNTWTKPGGLDVQLPDGSYSQVHPSGATPGTFFPLQMPIASLKTSFVYTHVAAPTGRGHLAYDMFLQNTPDQASGFGPNITHEIIIPLDYWGGYGVYPTRNPNWYDHDVTIDGILFHVYAAKDPDGGLRPTFNGGWKFIVFEPDRPIPPGTLDLAKIVNYVTTRKDAFGTPWANGNEYLMSVELGVEAQEGVGDIQVSNYRVWR